MVETLRGIRDEVGNQLAITLLLGSDAFRSLPKWHEWTSLITLANLLIVNRAKQQEHYPKPLKELIHSNQTLSKQDLIQYPYGNIYFYDDVHIDISSTIIRQTMNQQDHAKAMLPNGVFEYIKKEHLYERSPQQ